MNASENTAAALRELFFVRLADIYARSEIQSLYEIAMESLWGWGKFELAMHKQFRCSESEMLQIYRVLKRLRNCEPIQYILEEAHFYGLKLKVNAHVLIPRPETEELVQWVLEYVPPNTIAPYSLLDIGTGSGCIPIALKKNRPELHASGIDISEHALLIAKQNAQLHQLDIDFFRQDILSIDITKSKKKYDILVSNPPYVMQKERKHMHSNVLQYEPEQALFVEDHDPLLFYKAIVKVAPYLLLQGGKLFFEINEALGSELYKLLFQSGFHQIVLKKDIHGKNRMVGATFGKVPAV